VIGAHALPECDGEVTRCRNCQRLWTPALAGVPCDAPGARPVPSFRLALREAVATLYPEAGDPISLVGMPLPRPAVRTPEPDSARTWTGALPGAAAPISGPEWDGLTGRTANPDNFCCGPDCWVFCDDGVRWCEEHAPR
jgi:hypothetical protein